MKEAPWITRDVFFLKPQDFDPKIQGCQVATYGWSNKNSQKPCRSTSTVGGVQNMS